MTPEEQKKHNLRLGLTLATVVLALFFGIMLRWKWFGA